jgi:TolA-binding protein
LSALQFKAISQTGMGKAQGQSEDFVWTMLVEGGFAAVVGDFARGDGSAAWAQRAPAQLEQVAERLQATGVPLEEWPRSLLYEFGNRLYMANSRDRSPRRCSAVAVAVRNDKLVAAQFGDVRLALWAGGVLRLPLGGRWQQVVPDESVRDAPADEGKIALGLAPVESPLVLPQWETRLRDGDLVLCFSDGFEDCFPPAQLAEHLRQLAGQPVEAIATSLLKASSGADPADDETLLVLRSAIEATEDPARTAFAKLQQTVAGQQQQLVALTPRLDELATRVKGVEAGLLPLAEVRQQVVNQTAAANSTTGELRRLKGEIEAAKETAQTQESWITRLNARVDTVEKAYNERAEAIGVRGADAEQLQRLVDRVAALEAPRPDASSAAPHDVTPASAMADALEAPENASTASGPSDSAAQEKRAPDGTPTVPVPGSISGSTGKAPAGRYTDVRKRRSIRELLGSEIPPRRAFFCVLALLLFQAGLLWAAIESYNDAVREYQELIWRMNEHYIQTLKQLNARQLVPPQRAVGEGTGSTSDAPSRRRRGDE